MYSSFYGYFANVTIIEEKEINLMIKNGVDDWNYGLMCACYEGHMEIVKLMIENGANDLDSGLCRACGGGNIEIVNLIIEKGANDWNSGLSYACNEGHMEIVKLIIEKGADDLNFGLFYACQRGHIEIVKLLIEVYGADNWNCLHNTEDLSLYKLYILKTGNCNHDHYEKLVREQDPLYTIITHYDKNKHIKKLPFELWRKMREFL